jgi:energy-coupling factor transporter ATP-binding protein EcfA2
LTLVVGANSVGKSSLLQSMLLLAQASVYRSDGQVPLNGGVIQLGIFDQVRSDFGRERDAAIHIGADFSLGSDALRSVHDYRTDSALEAVVVDEKTDVIYCVDQDMVPSGKRSAAQVETVHISLRDGERTLARGLVFAELQPEVDAELLSQEAGLGPLPFASGYLSNEEVFDPGALERCFPRFGRLRRSGRVVGSVTDEGLAQLTLNAVSFQGGLPVAGRPLVSDVQVAVNRALDHSYRWSMTPEVRRAPELAEARGAAQALDSSDAAPKLTELVRPFVEDWLAGFPRSASELRSLLPRGAYDAGLILGITEREDFRGTILPRVVEVFSVGRSPRSVLDEPTAPLLAPWTHTWLDYLEGSVHYLGPLREDPSVTYPHGLSGSSHLPIGRKGENTAATLLQDRGDRRRPGFPGPGGRPLPSLHEALQMWVREFGLAQSVTSSDADGRGVGLTVDERDLTNVGTGVSQILPVLVICLQALPGDLVLLEQPELHLNPGMQQKLGDFFLEMARSGRQLVVETHSEYLVTRLRRRVVEDLSGEARGLFSLLFAVQIEGRTRFDVVETKPDGSFSFDTWPQGFFDQAGDDIQAIIRANAERRLATKSE